MNETGKCRIGEYIAAATLKALGFRYLGVEPEGRRCVFIFDDPDGKAADVLQKHENGGVPVNSAKIAAELGFIKTKMWESKGRDTDVDARNRQYR